MAEINYFAVHANTLKDLFDSFGDSCPTIGWNGNVYRAIVSGARQAGDNSAGGFSLDSDSSITMRVEDFGVGEFPASTEVISCPAGVYDYKIKSVVMMAGQKTFRIHVEDKNQSL